ncbi:MAG: hypothetical protein GX338_03320 [Firmicutes bacterium]|nr:hypothetical protein [Bacillota bacterium]
MSKGKIARITIMQMTRLTTDISIPSYTGFATCTLYLLTFIVWSIHGKKMSPAE